MLFSGHGEAIFFGARQLVCVFVNVTVQLGETPASELAVYSAQGVDLVNANVRQRSVLRLRRSTNRLPVPKLGSLPIAL